MRFACGDMRDHIVSYQNDHRPSYWRRRALRQQARLRIDFSEILRVVRFSTFATISALFGHGAMSDLSPLSGVKRKVDFGAVRAAFDPGCVKRARAKNAQNCFLYRLLLVVVASTFGFLIDGIETEFLRADCTSEFSRGQDPYRKSASRQWYVVPFRPSTLSSIGR